MHRPNAEIAIAGRRIGLDHPTYFIADIAANHDGDIERAKALLRAGEAGLAAVAAAAGFADQSHFTAAFKRETGTTPGRFRAETGRTANP